MTNADYDVEAVFRPTARRIPIGFDPPIHARRSYKVRLDHTTATVWPYALLGGAIQMIEAGGRRRYRLLARGLRVPIPRRLARRWLVAEEIR